MGDRLVSLLKRFELRARVFRSGPLCHSSLYSESDGMGYIHVLRSGGIRIHTKGEADRLVDRPSLLFYMSPTTHRLTPLDQGADTVCASFEFGAGLHNPLFAALPGLVLVALCELPNVAASVELLFREASEDHCGRQAILDRMIEVLIILLLRELMDQERIHTGLLAGLSDPRLARAINALHADPARAWTLETLARTAGMSRARFAVRFREIVGTTPMGYLAEWRLGVAQALLRKGAAVQAVADQVGYANASALSRAFSARIGITPGAWRRQQGGA